MMTKQVTNSPTTWDQDEREGRRNAVLAMASYWLASIAALVYMSSVGPWGNAAAWLWMPWLSITVLLNLIILAAIVYIEDGF